MTNPATSSSALPGAGVMLSDERASLEGFLDHYRAVLVTKVRGVSDADARRRLVPSATTLGGLLKHVACAEQRWFEYALPRVPFEPKSEAERLAEFGMTEDETVDGLIEAYEEQCARSREMAARYQLDDRGHRFGTDMTLRWIYLHMIEETARHAGHADILREQLDGATGD
ncbi:DinB family protein [Haloechinothrix halophila]|uniref:DinB family protein n=1 Tax=Haloechinothrix halophila TaxID=1069073 RepID=UPI000558CBBB|nr:DinB family protein [Haloechinothrix halophila]